MTKNALPDLWIGNTNRGMSSDQTDNSQHWLRWTGSETYRNPNPDPVGEGKTPYITTVDMVVGFHVCDLRICNGLQVDKTSDCQTPDASRMPLGAYVNAQGCSTAM